MTEELDPFELPEWVGETAVTWASEAGLGGHLVAGLLTGAPDLVLPCDLLAVDQAYPAPVVEADVRARAHQVWQHGQVLLVLHGAGHGRDPRHGVRRRRRARGVHPPGPGGGGRPGPLVGAPQPRPRLRIFGGSTSLRA